MYAVLHAPQFPLQALLRHDPAAWASPVVLVDPAQSTPRIVELNQPAAKAGIEPGFTAPQALARCPAIVVRHRSPKAEESTGNALLQAAYAFSPNIEATGPGWLTLDLRGLSELGPEPSHDALAAWAGRLHQVLAGLGLRCRIGVAPTPGVARHAAAAPVPEPVQIVTPATAEAFVDGLPVSLLEPTPHTAGALAKWGIRTVGEFKALGQADLADRFGLEAFALWAAASTRQSRPLRLVRPPEEYREECEFDPPVETLEPLLFLLRRFVDSLEVRLEPSGMAVGLLVLRLRQESGEQLERRLRIPQPTRRADVLFRMLQTHLEGVRTESPVSGVQLEVETARPSQHQFGLFEAALRDPHQFQETLARLSALVGADRVGSPFRRPGHRPDDFRLVPPDFENAPSPVGRRTPDILRPAPVRRLRPAQPVVVETQGAGVVGPTRVPATMPSEAARPARPAPVFRPAEVAAILDPVFRPKASGPAPGAARPESAVTEAGDLIPFPGMAQPAGAAGGLGSEPVVPAAEAPGRPVALRCELAQGRVTVALGPWESSGRWWEADAWSRTEWDVSVRGTIPLRLCWDGSAWQVEAVLD